MSRLGCVHAFRRIPPNAGSEPVFGRDCAFRRNTVTPRRKLDACTMSCSRAVLQRSDFQSEELLKRFGNSVARAQLRVELFKRVGKGFVETHRGALFSRPPVDIRGERGSGRLQVTLDNEL